MYLDPAQATVQKGSQGQYIISKFNDFCATDLKLTERDAQKMKEIVSFDESTKSPKDTLTFCEFICFFNIRSRDKTSDEITIEQIRTLLNEELRYGIKQRCIVSTVISNKHLHLLKEITNSQETDSLISLTVNQLIDMNIEDTTK